MAPRVIAVCMLLALCLGHALANQPGLHATVSSVGDDQRLLSPASAIRGNAAQRLLLQWPMGSAAQANAQAGSSSYGMGPGGFTGSHSQVCWQLSCSRTTCCWVQGTGTTVDGFVVT